MASAVIWSASVVICHIPGLRDASASKKKVQKCNHPNTPVSVQIDNLACCGQPVPTHPDVDKYMG